VTRRHVDLRRGRASVRIDAGPLSVAAALAATTLLAVLASVALGELAIAPFDVLSALAGAGDRTSRFVVLDLRLPRALAALLAGAALGLAGAVFQSVTRNPLVSPDVVGVAGGASLAAVAVIVLGSAQGTWSVPAAALAGALTSGAALYALAWRRGVQGYRIVLVGIGVAAFTQAGISYVLTEGRIFEVVTAYVWLVGSLNARGWPEVRPLAAALVLLAPVMVALGRRVDVLDLGDDVARGLGLGVERTRLAMLGMAVALTGIVVSTAGPIGFVAFIAPHIARRLARPARTQELLLVAAGCGAVLVLAADLAGRLLFAPNEIPVGIVTSIIAAPYFLALLRRAHRLGVAG
jgi:iron-siderophore transport system permease protein